MENIFFCGVEENRRRKRIEIFGKDNIFFINGEGKDLEKENIFFGGGEEERRRKRRKLFGEGN